MRARSFVCSPRSACGSSSSTSLVYLSSVVIVEVVELRSDFFQQTRQNEIIFRKEEGGVGNKQGRYLIIFGDDSINMSAVECDLSEFN